MSLSELFSLSHVSCSLSFSLFLPHQVQATWQAPNKIWLPSPQYLRTGAQQTSHQPAPVQVCPHLSASCRFRIILRVHNWLCMYGVLSLNQLWGHCKLWALHIAGNPKWGCICPWCNTPESRLGYTPASPCSSFSLSQLYWPFCYLCCCYLMDGHLAEFEEFLLSFCFTYFWFSKHTALTTTKVSQRLHKLPIFCAKVLPEIELPLKGPTDHFIATTSSQMCGCCWSSFPEAQLQAPPFVCFHWQQLVTL